MDTNTPTADSSNEYVTDSPKYTKAVTIAEPESMSPMVRPSLTSQENSNNAQSQSHRQHRASAGSKRLSGRPSYKASTSSLNSLNSLSLSEKSDGNGPEESHRSQETQRHHHGLHRTDPSRLVSQILDWLHDEKRKRSRRKGSYGGTPASQPFTDGSQDSLAGLAGRLRRPSNSSDRSLALEKLEQILAENNVVDPAALQTSSKESRPHTHARRTSSIRLLRRKSSFGPSSDTEYYEGDAIVPATDVVLDNSKTMGFSGGASDSSLDLLTTSKRVAREREGWLEFKNEIVKLAHTLRLKGWRRVPLDRGGDLHVERLSGALTNAVYVVSPPDNLPPVEVEGMNGTNSKKLKRKPQKLLLRVYGPQVEHLIDRESELQILRRLARKKIGPRLLGTFVNGRFEEFFHARTLTARDLRNPETSKQIAKRMRELHDGIDLLEAERNAGPFVWRNWDKWVARCEEVISWVDQQILSGDNVQRHSRNDRWKKRGLVCGVEWSIFRKTVEKYRKWLDQQYGGPSQIRDKLVFAHNDTQYGNLLRIEPSGESPLLMPENEHKQLVVIDFEYASANMRGLEFANHFTEWCYNYHDPDRAYICSTTLYPTPAEQHRFLKAYVQHRPQFHPNASATPKTTASGGPSSSISAFMLDSRSPSYNYTEEEKQREEQVEKEIQVLMRETRLWRVANTAQWVAWGIVQAKVEGMDEALAKAKGKLNGTSISTGTVASATEFPFEDSCQDKDTTPTQDDILTPTQSFDLDTSLARDKRPEGLVAEALANGEELSHEEDEEEEFDYLGYAQERAMFFWGDCLELGTIKEADLPKEVLAKVKRVDY